MAGTLLRSVYLDGVHLAPGTELTDEQAKRITNPNATEDRAVKGQDGRTDVVERRSADADKALTAPADGAKPAAKPGR